MFLFIRFLSIGILMWLSGLSSCMPSSTQANTTHNNVQMTPLPQDIDSPIPGAHRLSLYLPMIQSKKIGLIVNHTSRVEDTHLVDTLLKLGVDVHMIFAPEHGFRGQADAGEHISNEVDLQTNIKVVSL